MCIVDKIVGTTVFVKIEGYGEGTISTSEIAPGRIRNLRDYVVPNKKIVCKVIRVDGSGNADLSLRRVKAKERKEILDSYEKEKNLIGALKTIFENPKEIIEAIKKQEDVLEFFEQARTNPKLLEKFMKKSEAEKVSKILKEKKEKEISVKKEFSLTSEAGDGLLRIKEAIPEGTSYLGAGKFLITVKNKEYKDAKHKINTILEEIEEKARKRGLVFSAEKTK